ncbi:MAG: DUF1134 domain-containing protein [Hyphomicrobium sp.]|uniref:DUF1134 domain-containing protein n=1 Tax=Hyphomicrobium sp. TaxID=82 RepID=UPI003D0B3BD0
MNIRRRRHLALVGLALTLALSLAGAPASAETCTADSFGDAVDASAAELRAFSAETQPKLKAKLASLRDSKGWAAEPDYETKGLKLVHDAKLDEFDSEASSLLSKIDTLGSPDATDGVADTSCASLSDLKAASSELMAVMRAKSAYLISKIDREIEKAPPPAAPTEVAKAEVAKTEVAKTEPERTAPAPAAEPAQTVPAKTVPAAEPMPDLSPIRRTDPPKAPPQATAPAPSPPLSPAPAPTPPAAAPTPEAAPPKQEAAAPSKDSERSSSWSTTTAEAIIPPPPVYDAPPPGTPYALPPVGEDGQTADGETVDGETTFDAEGGGYTIDEIQVATRGFFGTISTSLASVIEHAFQKSGRPTAYVLGNEGGGAFLAGLRYGEGTLYLRGGGSQKVYWHGPSIGYDVGAEGSRTLFLIYDLHEPNTIFRRYTGVDGSAYLVGGVGMTLLKGGDVTMAPIRSGLGLRLGASIGYVRFSSRPTWNPF